MNGEITFKDIFALLKKSFVRIVVYVLIAVVLAGAVGGAVILLTKDDASYQAIVQYNYKNAEDGLDPWGMRLDVSKVKADKIVMNALSSLNYSNERIAELKPDIIANISISGIVPEDAMTKILTIKEIATKNPTSLNDLTTLSYISTSYVVTLKGEKEMKLTSNEYADILNSIIDTYISEFRNIYGYGDLLGTKVAEVIEYEKYDYIQIYSLLEAQLREVITYLNDRIGVAKDFRSTNTKVSFFDLKEKADKIINYELSFLETYIMENGIQKAQKDLASILYIQERIRNIEDSMALAEAKLLATEEAIEKFEHQYNIYTDTNGNRTETPANGEIYAKLFSDLTTFSGTIAELESSLGKWKRWEDKFLAPGGEGETAVADTMINSVNTKVIDLLTQINETVDEYIAVEVMKNSVVRSVAATKVEDETNSILVLFAVEVVVIIISALIAISITKKKGADLKFKKAAPDKKEESEEEEES